MTRGISGLVLTTALSIVLAVTGCTKPPEQLVVDLGDPQLLVREKAKQGLLELDKQAIPALLAGIEDGEAQGGIGNVLTKIGEASYEPSSVRIHELCKADEPNKGAIAELMKVMEAVGTPAEILDSYLAAAAEGGCADRAMLSLIKRIQPPKNDVTIDPGTNLRYKPVRFRYKRGPDLTASRALARLCLYDPVLGNKAMEMTRDKDEEVYWNQWRMHDPLVRASVSRHMSDIIWGEFHDNFVPDILAEEEKANPEDPLMLMGELATYWRGRRYDPYAASRLTRAHQGLEVYFATNDHFFDEPCLCYQALEEIAKPVRGSLDSANRKKEMQALDEALAPLAADREAACNL